MELTEAQWLLLRGLVARAAQDEAERLSRMTGRPVGSHSVEKLEEARALAHDLAELEAVVEKEAGRDASLTSSALVEELRREATFPRGRGLAHLLLRAADELELGGQRS